MDFTKMQGAGNDFIVIETGDANRDWSQLAMAMCDRHFGIGGDGLLLVLRSNVADFRMRVFNQDGSEADACGNGLRCLVKYVLEKGLFKAGAGQMLIEIMSGISKVNLNQIGDQATEIQVSLGKPKLGAEDIPVAIEQSSAIANVKPILDYPVTVDSIELLLNPIGVGNPHAVYFSPLPVADFPLSRLGPKVEHHKIFPKKVNFEVARIIDRKRIEVRVWERGVGETLACGSGACAVVVAAHLHGYVDNEVDIILPGGTLGIEWDGAGEVFLNGPAEIVFTGEWPDETCKTN